LSPPDNFDDLLRILLHLSAANLLGLSDEDGQATITMAIGAFVALAQWIIPYGVNVYWMPVATAGMLAVVFSLPSGVIRAVGGWLSDRFGGRAVMYWVLGSSVLVLMRS
jgi:MFS family permease